MQHVNDTNHTCNDCGDYVDPLDNTLRPNVLGEIRCADCDEAYDTCGLCHVEYHTDGHCECDYCMVCSVPIDGEQASCGDCIHDCVHMYNDAEQACYRCGYAAPEPGAHLRLILGGRK